MMGQSSSARPARRAVLERSRPNLDVKQTLAAREQRDSSVTLRGQVLDELADGAVLVSTDDVHLL